MKAKLSVVALAGLMALWMGGAVWGQTSIPATLTVSNDNCPGGVQITQIFWVRDGTPLHVQLFSPAVTIRQGEKRDFQFELSATPTAAIVRGQAVLFVAPAVPFEVNVPVGSTVQYQCGTMTAAIGAQPTPPAGQLQLPPQLAGLRPEMTPAQLIAALRAAGAEVEEQGSQARPKLSDTEDPLLIGAFGAGFQAVGIWASSGTGQLRAAVVYDRPTAPIYLWVVGIPTLAWCVSTPAPGGCLEVSCDKPAAFEPFTTFGTAPVPGTVFFILIIKLGGPAMPYVLALSG